MSVSCTFLCSKCSFTECNNGSYGNNCLEKCSANCLNTPCNHSTGECTDGCKDGWQGFNCSQSLFLIFKETVLLIHFYFISNKSHFWRLRRYMRLATTWIWLGATILIHMVHFFCKFNGVFVHHLNIFSLLMCHL